MWVSASFLFSPSVICSTRPFVSGDGCSLWYRPPTLVIIAGSGTVLPVTTMFLTHSASKQAPSATVRCGLSCQKPGWVTCRSVSVFVALLCSWGGGNLLPVDTSIVPFQFALAKTTAPAMVLFFKGALCNWLVCLAILDGNPYRAQQIPRYLGGVCWRLSLPATALRCQLVTLLLPSLVRPPP